MAQLQTGIPIPVDTIKFLLIWIFTIAGSLLLIAGVVLEARMRKALREAKYPDEPGAPRDSRQGSLQPRIDTRRKQSGSNRLYDEAPPPEAAGDGRLSNVL